MNKKCHLLLWFAAVLLPAAQGLSAEADSNASESREYKIKAAFLYNFLKTCEWPKEALGDKEESLRIGIIGDDLFGDSFKPIEDQTIKERKIQILRFRGFSRYPKDSKGLPKVPEDQQEALRTCHVLFLCKSEKSVFREILRVTNNLPVLTVSEMEEFLEAGGMINFLPEATRGEFEINLIEIENVKLKVSSKVLRIAKRVIEKKKEEGS